jgi:hypothetical protein
MAAKKQKDFVYWIIHEVCEMDGDHLTDIKMLSVQANWKMKPEFDEAKALKLTKKVCALAQELDLLTVDQDGPVRWIRPNFDYLNERTSKSKQLKYADAIRRREYE